MFMTGAQMAEYGQAEYGGPQRRRRARWAGEAEGGYGAGEYGPGEAEYGPGEYGPGEAEYGRSEYGPGEAEYGPGEAEYGPGEAEYGPGEYGPGEAEYGPGEAEYGPGEAEYGPGEAEYGQGEGEEQFLPLIPIIGQVLGGLLGGLKKEGESEYGQGEYGQSEYGQGEAGEAEEQFLHNILTRVLGQEAEAGESVLSPAQEAEYAARLLEVSSEEELGRLLGGIVNTAGRVFQGVRDAVNSPQGRAFVNAVTPLARAALPTVGGAIGSAIAPGAGMQIGRTLGSTASSLFETESAGLNPEQEQFEVARRFVRLASAAARDVAMAPADAPPELVGEFGIFRAARYLARPLFNRALRSISPFARRYYGGRSYGFRGGYRGGYRYGRPYRRYYGGYGRYGRLGGYRRYRYGYGYPQPAAPAPSLEASRRRPRHPRRNRHPRLPSPATAGSRCQSARPLRPGGLRRRRGLVPMHRRRNPALRGRASSATTARVPATAAGAAGAAAPLAAGSAAAARSSFWARESMNVGPSATWLLEQETRALLTRLASVQPFVLQETYLAAAALSPAALSGIEQHLIAGLARRVPAGPGVPPLAARPGCSGTSGRAAAPVLDAPAELPERVVPVRLVLRGDHPAKRTRQRGPAVRAGRRGGRGTAGAGQVLRGTAGDLLIPPRARRSHPPSPDKAARRWRQSRRPYPDPPGAGDRIRHRILAGARGRAPGRGAAPASGVAAGAAPPDPDAVGPAEGLGSVGPVDL